VAENGTKKRSKFLFIGGGGGSVLQRGIKMGHHSKKRLEVQKGNARVFGT